MDLEVHRDARGDLVALEERTNLPFRLRRIFYMKVDRAGTVRANHATSSDLMITAVMGSAIMDVDNGSERATYSLHSPGRGVWARPGVYIRLRDFSPPTVLLVCASKHFEDTRYFDTPQPVLIETEELV